MLSGNVILSNGVQMPRIGFGCAHVIGDTQEQAVHAALEAGYRLFDNAALYGNEEGIGKALRSGGVPRTELFISSKLRNREQGYENALQGFEDSLKRLGVDYLDLYLIHFPMPKRGLYVETWHALEHLYEQGLVRAIGVSNFESHHIETILQVCSVPPMVDQLECNPYLAVFPLREYCRRHAIQVEAWFPLGGRLLDRDGNPVKLDRAPLLENEIIADIAKARGRTTAQVVLRWEVQSAIIPVPKSERPERIRDNFDVFDFALTPEEMQRIDSLDCNGRRGPHPDECHDMF